ncbi:Smr/MutS family protein [Feifania hominis]|uniref:Smr/MutS family protein n=1 Tax=Feifania hominis TaxID=2763660 RepID=A0A926HQN6_9FIRM|nr:Smr/MutS family protein [Feifania hominis]
MAGMKTANIEQGMPLVDQAIRRLTYEIHAARAGGFAVLKVIHGYGSSGTGGRIRVEVRRYLDSLVRRGQIRGYAPGERFSIFDEMSRKIITGCPDAARDRDLDRSNNGVTFVLL